jgi:hypothetical protein
MSMEELRQIVKASPFRPVEIVLVDGRRFPVEHPENMLVPPGSRDTLIAVLNKNGVIELVNTLVISTIRPLPVRKNKPRKAG